MRIRQVKPEFWRDERLADLAPDVRLTYIGLWMIADDSGWMRLSMAEIGVDLYPYLDRRDREEMVSRAIGILIDHGRVVPHSCHHAHLPNLTRHQRLSSPDKRVTTIEREHRGCAPGTGEGPRMPAGIGGADAKDRGIPRMPADARHGTERNGTER